MTIYIAGPDGKPLAFATHAEADAYVRERREAEPALVKCLRRHQVAAHWLLEQARHALRQPRGRVEAPRGIVSDLDIAAAREAANPTALGSQVSGEGEPVP
jgi:hypothetical protein